MLLLLCCLFSFLSYSSITSRQRYYFVPQHLNKRQAPKRNLPSLFKKAIKQKRIPLEIVGILCQNFVVHILKDGIVTVQYSCLANIILISILYLCGSMNNLVSLVSQPSVQRKTDKAKLSSAICTGCIKTNRIFQYRKCQALDISSHI